MNRRGFLGALMAVGGEVIVCGPIVVPNYAKPLMATLVRAGTLEASKITTGSITASVIRIGRLSFRNHGLFGNHYKKLSRVERAVLADYRRALG